MVTLEAISSLVTRLLRTAPEGRRADVKVPPVGGMGSTAAVPPVTSTEGGHLKMEWARVCFSCGRQGHGVNRCSQVDTSFPFLPRGWSRDVRNGQYQAMRTGGTDVWSAPGNEGWSGREGQPPGSSGIKAQLTLVEEAGDDSYVDRVAMLNPIEHSGVSEMEDLLSAVTIPEPLEHSVLEVPLEAGGGAVDGAAKPNPIEHSGVSETEDLLSVVTIPEPLEHSVLEVPLKVGGGAVDGAAKPNPLEHVGVSELAGTPSASHPRRHEETMVSRAICVKRLCYWILGGMTSGPCGLLGCTVVPDRLGRRSGN